MGSEWIRFLYEVPETKGKSLEQIEAELTGGQKPDQSLMCARDLRGAKRHARSLA